MDEEKIYSIFMLIIFNQNMYICVWEVIYLMIPTDWWGFSIVSSP